MNDFINSLKNVIASFEDKQKFDSHEVYSEIIKLGDSCPEEIKIKEYWWERFAFTWYKARLQKEECNHDFWSQLQEDNPELPYDYWQKRVTEVSNPLLKLQYTGLCWEYSKRENILKGDQQNAQMAIDSIIEIAIKHLYKFETSVIDKLEWALDVALNIRDDKRAEKVRDTVIACEEQIAKDHLCGLWGFSYDFLIDNKKAKKLITPIIEKQIIDGLENRLNRLAAAPGGKMVENEIAVEMSATRLADYYKKKHLTNEMKSVLAKYALVVEKIEDNSAMRTSFFLKKLYHTLKSYGLNENADKIAVKLREVEKTIPGEMVKHEHTIEIKKEEFGDFIDKITANGLETSIKRIISRYIPDLQGYYKKLEDLADRYVGVYRLCPQLVLDHKGRTVAIINTYIDPKEEKDDELRNKKNEGQLFYLIASEMSQVLPVFFRAIIDRLVEKYALSAEWLLDFLYQSPVFEEDKEPVIKFGLRAYFEKNYYAAIHILIPQIEEAIRNLVEMNGFNIYKRIKDGGMLLKTFDDLLDDIIELEVLPINISYYFRILYTDPRGWNLRNQICHGFYPIEILNYAVADRVIHSLLCLALVRKKRRD